MFILEHNSYALLCNLFFALILGLGQYFITVHNTDLVHLTAALYAYNILYSLIGIEYLGYFIIIIIFYSNYNVKMTMRAYTLLCNL